MKILWFSNKILFGSADSSSGSWLDAMSEALLQLGDLKLGNITFGKVSSVEKKRSGTIEQWVVPSNYHCNDLNSLPYLPDILRVVDEFSPDLFHVWGTESFWGLLTARKFIKVPSVLDMQGLHSAIAKVYHGGLNISEQMACIGLKEILKGSMIFQEARKYQKWGVVEEEIINRHQFIIVQSNWMESQVKRINGSIQLFFNARILRKPFYKSKAWIPKNKKVVFCSVAYPSPFKGLHVAFRAIALLKKKYPNIEIRIAGLLQKNGIRQDGYIRWLNQQIDKLDIRSNVVWLGGLNANQVIQELLDSEAMILPSFIENCSNTLQEAMMIGLPVVSSYVGGLPSLAKDEESILFFSPGDEIMCAFQLERLLMDHALTRRISKTAREIAFNRNNQEVTVNKQYEIYRKVIEGS
jgi:glycosyltransferase involved in cell wall biosynthesis